MSTPDLTTDPKLTGPNLTGAARLADAAPSSAKAPYPRAARLTARRVGWLLLAIPVGFALLYPLLMPGDPARQSLSEMMTPPGATHPFGTDHLGRDLALRVAAALRLSLGVGIAASLAAAVLGTLAGVAAGLRGGWLDRVFSILADIVLSVPGLLLVLLIAAIAPGQMWPIYLGVALTLTVEFFRMARAEAARLAAGTGLASARLLGLSPGFVLRHHVWPVIGPLTGTLVVMGTATTILSVAALGFVQVGVRPPRAELGQMMVEMLPYYAEGPWVILFPSAALFLSVIGLTLIAGVRR